MSSIKKITDKIITLLGGYTAEAYDEVVTESDCLREKYTDLIEVNIQLKSKIAELTNKE